MNELRHTVMALVVLAVLGLGWLAIDETGDGETERVLVAAVDPLHVLSVQVANEHGTFTLHRNTEGRWVLTVPGSAEAEWATDPRAIDAFLADLSRVQAERWLSSRPVGEDLGLTPPRATIRWQTSDGEGTLLLGRSTGASGTMYGAILGDERVFCVAAARLVHLLASPMAMLDRTIARIPFARLQRLTIVNGSGSMTFTAVGEGLFELRGRQTARAYPPKVVWLTDELSNLRADGFTDLAGHTLADFGFDRPNVTVEAVFAPPMAPITLVLGKRLPDSPAVVYVRRDDQPLAYQVESSHFTALLAAEDEFRDRSPFTLPGEPPDYIEIFDLRSERVRRASLISRITRWDAQYRSNRPVDRNIGGKLLPALADVRILSFRRLPEQDLAALGLTEPQFRIMFSVGNDPAQWFVVGRAPSNRVYVLLPDQAVVQVDPSVLSLLADVVTAHGEPWPPVVSATPIKGT